MLWWLLAVAFLSILWAGMWKNLTRMAFGVLFGLPLGWLFSLYIQNNVHMQDIPIWLPPLPFAIVATLLLVVGLVLWFRADDDSDGKPGQRDSEDQRH
jgi:hypothetical protein